jgi:hypothetical protein
MNICILCKDEDLTRAREESKNIFPKTDSSKNLVIPVSETGLEPATHWFCFMNVQESFYNYLLDIKDTLIIENIPPKEFLNKWGFKLIK